MVPREMKWSVYEDPGSVVFRIHVSRKNASEEVVHELESNCIKCMISHGTSSPWKASICMSCTDWTKTVVFTERHYMWHVIVVSTDPTNQLTFDKRNSVQYNGETPVGIPWNYNWATELQDDLEVVMM